MMELPHHVPGQHPGRRRAPEPTPAQRERGTPRRPWHGEPSPPGELSGHLQRVPVRQSLGGVQPGPPGRQSRVPARRRMPGGGAGAQAPTQAPAHAGDFRAESGAGQQGRAVGAAQNHRPRKEGVRRLREAPTVRSLRCFPLSPLPAWRPQPPSLLCTGCPEVWGEGSRESPGQRPLLPTPASKSPFCPRLLRALARLSLPPLPSSPPLRPHRPRPPRLPPSLRRGHVRSPFLPRRPPRVSAPPPRPPGRAPPPPAPAPRRAASCAQRREPR